MKGAAYNSTPVDRKGTGRIWEIDFFRGIALVLMVFFHLLYDLKEFYGYPVSYNSGIFYYIGKASGILFIIISAISTGFSRNNRVRAGKFLTAALLITVATHIYDPGFGIKYGILHFLGTCVLLYPLFRNIGQYSLALLGTVIIISGQYLGRLDIGHSYLFLFNLTGPGWTSADYYPLFPWLGVFFYGMAIEKILYPGRVSLIRFKPQRDFLSFIGRHTFLVYLLHQPVLLLVIGLYAVLTK